MCAPLRFHFPPGRPATLLPEVEEVTPPGLISNTLNQPSHLIANLDSVSDRMKVFGNAIFFVRPCSCAEHTDLGQCPLSRFPERVLIVSLMRLETIEELPQFPHERPITQSTNHFRLLAHHLGFRTSVHSINHVNFLGPLLAAMSLGHTYLPSNSLLPQG
jgi:hypothetical protein